MRKDIQTRFKADGDRPKGNPRALRFPAEIEQELNKAKDWKALVIDAVQKDLFSQRQWSDEEGDQAIAIEMFSRLRLLLPQAVKMLPQDGCLSLEAYGLLIEMLISDRPLFIVQGTSEFRLQWRDDDWNIECNQAILWSELEKAQEFCENLMHIWEQVMLSFEFADRID